MLRLRDIGRNAASIGRALRPSGIDNNHDPAAVPRRHDRVGHLIDLTFVAIPAATVFPFSATLTAFAPVVFASALLGHGIVTSLRRARRARLRAESYRVEADASRLLQPGHAVVSGRVAYAQEAPAAMRVDLVQEGSESESSGVWTHSWTEVCRKLTVNPFYLVQDAQTRIRVEPDRDSQLFDDFDAKVLVRWHGPPRRRQRVATLVPDEHVWAVGRLERDDDPEAHGARAASYRDSATPEGWVLRGAPTLLVSSVPLVAHFRGRAAMHLWHAVLFCLFLVFPGVLAARRIDRLAGETVTGTVVAVSSRTDSDSGSTSYTAKVKARGETWESESLAHEPDMGSPFVLRLGSWTSNDGADVSWSSGEIGLLFVLVAVSFGLRLAVRSRSLRTLPWYRSNRPYVEGGRGRLPQ